MHRLRSLCPGLSGVGNFRARRPAREVEAVYGTERELRESRQIHARRVRQTPEQIAFGYLACSSMRNPCFVMTMSIEQIELPGRDLRIAQNSGCAPRLAVLELNSSCHSICA